MRLVPVVLALAGSADAACPKGAALVDVARRAFPVEVREHGDGSERALDLAHLRCTVVRGTVARSLVTFDTGDGLLVALVAGARVLWEHGTIITGTPNRSIDDVRVADLDGDGTDEILETEGRQGHELLTSRTLFIMAADPDGTGDGGSIELATRYPEPPGWDCASTWKLVPERKRLLVTFDGRCTGGAPDGFLIGHRVFEWRAGSLVER